MPNTNNQTIHQFGAGISQMVRQATGRDNVESIEMDWVTTEQTSKYVEYEKSGEVVSFYCTIDDPMEVTVAINPIQDLHGQESPYPAGGGKNKLPLPVAETKNGVTLVHNADGSITLTGTSTGIAYFDFFAGTFDSSTYEGYKLTCEANQSVTWGASGITIRISNSTRESLQDYGGSETTIANNGTGLYMALRITSSYAFPSGGITFKPMLRASGESDTYAPYSNICPITGWSGANLCRTGKNLIDATEIYTGSNFTWSNGEVTSTAAKFYAVKYSIPSKLIGKTLTFQAYAVANGSVNLCACANVNGTNIIGNAIAQNATGKTSVTFTPSTANDTIFINYGSSGGGIVTLKELMLAEESTASAYEPYTDTVTPIAFPSSAGTVYGGTLTVNKDGSGTLVVDRATRTFTGSNSESWTQSSETFYTIDITDYSKTDQSKAIANKYKAQGLIPGRNYLTVNNRLAFYSGTDYNRVFIRDSRFANVTALRAGLASENLSVVYELATPIEIDLTELEVIETLIGENNVWADTGPVSVKYITKEDIL